MNTPTRVAAAFVLATTAAGTGCFDAEDTATAESPLSGAIFTTTADGARVNANIFTNATDVYLDGGPGPQAPSSAAALPPGDYFFQVTDPSGRDLLSTDHVSCRRIRIADGGVIVEAYAGTSYVASGAGFAPVPCQHAQGTDADHAELGAITVQLFPFDPTPNPGGEYKVWVTAVDAYRGDPAYVPTAPGDTINGETGRVRGVAHGFAPSDSKTDNFKVRVHDGVPPPPPPTPEPCCGDGHVDAGETCDDGNTTGGDGCSATCTLEPPTPEPCCGDGVVDAGETCDDGNTTGGDGCSATCTLEPPPEPTPAPCCGDGVVDAGEACDDGNTTGGDGCSATCAVEDAPGGGGNGHGHGH